MSNFDAAIDISSKLCKALSGVIRGRDDTIKLIVSALAADGHVLLEDYPGSGKTVLTKTLGRLIGPDLDSPAVLSHIAPFRRIQFTPDLLPSDVLGVNIFDPKSATFNFIHGPIFAHVVLADEINRTGPKVQAAFLECMAEKQVTIDNLSHKLDRLFFVIGTQNPLDVAGTYPLPIVQLDRFMIKIPMNYVSRSDELDILSHHSEIQDLVESIAPVCCRSDILNLQDNCKLVSVASSIREAIVDLVQATRSQPSLQYGASTRAAVMLQQAVRGWAIVNGRNYVTEDDLKVMAPYVLLHRLKFHGAARDSMEAFNQIANPILDKVISSTI